MPAAKASLLLLALALGAYLLFWPVPIRPVAWQSPEDAGLTGAFAANDRLAATEIIPIGEFEGPEDIAAAPGGAVYAATLSGAIIRVGTDGSVSEFADAGPRPLGIEPDRDGNLIVANSYRGLQRISADGLVTNLLAEVDGKPLVYANDLAVAADGAIYFSESSTRFGAHAGGGTYEASLLDLLEHGGHGRVLEFRPDTGAVRVVIDGLNYANGVAMGDDQRYFLVAETGAYRVLRHWLSGPEAGLTEVIVDNLPGFPDNINTGRDGRFWIGLVAPRNAFLDFSADKPWLRKLVQRLPATLRPRAQPSAHVIAINGDGDILMSLQDPDARIPSLTGVHESADALYLSSLFGHAIGRLPITALQ